MITLDTRLALDPRVRFRRFEHEGIVIQQTSAEVLVVSEVATRLLELTNGTRSLRECITLLGEEFEADEPTIEADVIRFAGELVDAGVAAVQ